MQHDMIGVICAQTGSIRRLLVDAGQARGGGWARISSSRFAAWGSLGAFGWGVGGGGVKSNVRPSSR